MARKPAHDLSFNKGSWELHLEGVTPNEGVTTLIGRFDNRFAENASEALRRAGISHSPRIYPDLDRAPSGAANTLTISGAENITTFAIKQPGRVRFNLNDIPETLRHIAEDAVFTQQGNNSALLKGAWEHIAEELSSSPDAQTLVGVFTDPQEAINAARQAARHGFIAPQRAMTDLAFSLGTAMGDFEDDFEHRIPVIGEAHTQQLDDILKGQGEEPETPHPRKHPGALFIETILEQKHFDHADRVAMNISVGKEARSTINSVALDLVETPAQSPNPFNPGKPLSY
jgi:hypothetical protein